ncbi:ABC transporter permease [Planococcus shixiaomingii]|uniref:ABC transporter permease n=1 Tax=Planococcus shixiaomingii TaxID=3058393 RepID=UPI002631F7B3|nr:ABC transporter permease subunit [Planococcus sp. N022]WKA56565.1 ABC transporter permease subunit [Planococcus sp. N022]
MRLVKRLLKNKLFLTGFSMIAGCFLVSLFYFIFFNDQIPSTSLLFSENRKPLPPPYSGSVYPPFGTDEFGRDIAFVMLVGAKYTIGAALLITMLRVVPAVFIGLFLQFFLKELKRPLKSIADSINYFPTTLLAFLLLNWATREGVFMQDAVPSFGVQVLLYIAVLSLIFIPLNSVLVANEVELIYRKEFIECSRTLGAGTWRIIFKHIRPFLIPQLFVIFIREFIQTLILMSHLGILGIFIGGTVFKKNLFDRGTASSRSGEWAGTLGMWWDYLWTSYPWMAFIPIIFLTLLILAAKAMLDSLETVLSSEEQVTQVKDEGIPESARAGTLMPFRLLYPNKE